MLTEPRFMVGKHTLSATRNRILIPTEWRHAFHRGETVFLLKDEECVALFPTTTLHEWFCGTLDFALPTRQLNLSLQKLLDGGPDSSGIAKKLVDALCEVRDRRGPLVFSFARLSQAYRLSLPGWVLDCTAENGRLCAIGAINRILLWRMSELDRLEDEAFSADLLDALHHLSCS